MCNQIPGGEKGVQGKTNQAFPEKRTQKVRQGGQSKVQK